MADLLQSLILSNITLFLIVGLLLVLISSWAISIREYAGYLLGWLIGVLLILMISVFTVGQPTYDEAQIQMIFGPAVFLGLMIASILGLAIGAVSMAFVRVDSQGRARTIRALIIAVATSFTLASAYLMIIASFSFRLVIAAFVLAVAIGGLFNIILTRQGSRLTSVVSSDPLLEPNGLAQSAEPDVIISDLPSPLAQRIHNLRQRARRSGE
jgi:hypothetical protein